MKKIILIILIILSLFIISCYPQETGQEERIKELESKIEDLESKVGSLKGELVEEQPIEVDYEVDLTVWTEDDIVESIAQINLDFEDASWFQYEYDGEGRYYDLYGPFFPFDPFNSIAHSKRNRELTVNSLRIFNLDPGEQGIGQERFEKYLASINRETNKNLNLFCQEKTECRQILKVTCTVDNQEFYAWYAYPYLLTTRNDDGVTYQNFKEIYCSEKN